MLGCSYQTTPVAQSLDYNIKFVIDSEPQLVL